MTITIEFDCYYGDDVDDIIGDEEIRVLIKKHGGKVVFFRLRGPGGGNPNYGIEVASINVARQFLSELYGEPEDNINHHIRPNGSFNAYWKG